MNILVISLAGIGDTLFATPLIHELRANFPKARIDALVRWKGSKDVLEGNPHLNATHQRDLVKVGPTDALSFLWKLRAEKYDLSLNTHPQSRVLYRGVARFVNARTRLSHSYENASVFDRLLVNQMIPQDYAKHAVENNLALLPIVGAKILLPGHNYEIYLSDADRSWATAALEQHQLTGRKLIGIHVGSGGTKNLALRRWPLESYLELLGKLRAAYPEVGVLLFGGPEEERDNQILLDQTKRDHVLAIKTPSLRHAAALIEHCELFLSVDTSLMHVAAAMKVRKQLVIETPTWNKPIQPHQHPFVLVPNPAVAGKNLKYYRYDGRGIRGTAEEIRQCMNSVTVDAVFQVISDALTK